MALKVFLLVFLALLISEGAFGNPDCEKYYFRSCIVQRFSTELPRDASEFNLWCQETKAQIRCLKDYQDGCRTARYVLLELPELFQVTDNLLAHLCEEETFLNSVATEHVNCFSDTLSNTNCREDADAVIRPHIAANEDPEWRYTVLSCLKGALTHSCAALALLNNCEKTVAEVTLLLMNRGKTLDYYCLASGAKSVLDSLDKFELSKEQRGIIKVLLEKVIERDI